MRRHYLYSTRGNAKRLHLCFKDTCTTLCGIEIQNAARGQKQGLKPCEDCEYVFEERKGFATSLVKDEADFLTRVIKKETK